MEQTEFSAQRVLMLGPKNHAIQVLRSVLVIVGVGKIVHLEDAPSALDLLTMEHFHAVFCVLDGDAQSEFAIAARRRSAMLNPTIPIFMLQTQVKRRQIEKARDSGVTDFLTTPVSPKTVAAKLKAAMKNPRPFIVAQEFFGPDRRAKARPTYLGNDRRKRAPRKMRFDLTHL
jgi:CheY-like chemotaxis protein